MEDRPPDTPERHETAQPPPQEIEEKRPLGALLVVGFLLIAILVSWFGMFFLDRVRG